MAVRLQTSRRPSVQLSSLVLSSAAEGSRAAARLEPQEVRVADLRVEAGVTASVLLEVKELST